MRFLQESQSLRQKEQGYLQGPWRGCQWGISVLRGAELQFCKAKKVLEMNGGDGCVIVGVHLVLMDYTFQWFQR